MIDSNCNGFYEINDKPLMSNKLYALIEASNQNAELKFNYFNDIFENVDKSNLGNVRLVDLYVERAKQLRDSYDYLLLNYSGGSDSHNILHTFLKNNIKLDCIYVQMPFKYLNSTLHKPNNIDLTNENYHSEWDYTIKQDLDYVSKFFPDIKIELGDYTDTLHSKFYSDSLFETNSLVMTNISRGLKLHTFSKFETEVASKGKTVGSIYGVGKPYIVVKNNKVYFYFYDRGCVAIPNSNNPAGIEYFYWSPKFPKIVVEQSYSVYQWFKNNIDKKYLIMAKSLRTEPNFKNWPMHMHKSEMEQYYEIVKQVCYPNWDNRRFQVSKPGGEFDYAAGFKPWDKLLIMSGEFLKFGDIWSYYYNSYQNKIDKKYLRAYDETINIKTKWFYLCEE